MSATAAGSDTSEPDTCKICFDTFTTTLRKPICCPKCSYSACIQCVKRYLLTIVNDPHCLNCNFGWTPAFLRQNLTFTFMNNEWNEHRKQILWRLEEAYLPEAQVVAERHVRAKALEIEMKPFHEKAEKLRLELRKVEKQISDMYRLISNLRTGRANETSAAETKERRAFVRRCTHTDCNGFLSTAWKCGICENYTCSDCLAVKGKDRDASHTCNKDDLETAKLIAKDTKPCPKCGEGIFKTEGCSQMFCTSCKTPFDWNTMKIISSGVIHNPHYFAFMREMGANPGRAVGDMLCGGMPDMRAFRIKDKTIEKNFSDIFRHVNHTMDVESRAFNAHVEENNNLELRVKYLLKQTTKSDIEAVLVTNEKKRERHRVIRQVLDTFGNVAAEIFRRYLAEGSAKVSTEPNIYDTLWPQYKIELEGLRDYCNKEMLEISYYFKCSVPNWSSEDWRYNTVTYADIRTSERGRFQNAMSQIIKSTEPVAAKPASKPKSKVAAATTNLVVDGLHPSVLPGVQAPLTLPQPPLPSLDSL